MYIYVNMCVFVYVGYSHLVGAGEQAIDCHCLFLWWNEPNMDWRLTWRLEFLAMRCGTRDSTPISKGKAGERGLTHPGGDGIGRGQKVAVMWPLTLGPSVEVFYQMSVCLSIRTCSALGCLPHDHTLDASCPSSSSVLPCRHPSFRSSAGIPRLFWNVLGTCDPRLGLHWRPGRRHPPNCILKCYEHLLWRDPGPWLGFYRRSGRRCTFNCILGHFGYLTS